MAHDTQAGLEKAREWLVDGTPSAVHYAALELRMIMEDLTYKKLRDAADIIPPEVLGTWQPPQAVRALLEFDELADQSFTIEVGKHPPNSEVEQEWLVLGEHHALSLRWLRKHYNKVGSLLHVPAPRDPAPAQLVEALSYLATIADELETALASGITGFKWRGGYTFNCADCGKLVVRNVTALKGGQTAICSTDGCGAEYRAAEGPDGNVNMIPVRAVFKCVACKAPTSFPPRRVKMGFEFRCTQCRLLHRVVTYQWGAISVDPSSPQPELTTPSAH